MKDLNFTIVLGAPGAGSGKVAEMLKELGLFGGDMPAGPRGEFENRAVYSLAVAPYVEKFYLRKNKDGTRDRFPRSAPIPFAPESFYYHPPYFRDLVLGIFLRDGWDGETPLFLKIHDIAFMIPVFLQAFPEARWLVVQNDRADIIQSMQTRKWLPESEQPLTEQQLKPVDLFFQCLEALLANPDAFTNSIPFKDIELGNFQSLEPAIRAIGSAYDPDQIRELLDGRKFKTRKGQKLRVVCVLKTGGRYDTDDVHNLRRLVAESLTIEHELICYSDDPSVADIPLEFDLNGWWSKAEVFKEIGPVLFLDLDTYVLPGLDALAKQILSWPSAATHFGMLINRIPAKPYWHGGGVMAWNGDFSYILKELTSGDIDQLGMDDLYVSQKLRDRGVKPVVLNTLLPGFYSWRDDIAPKGGQVPDDAYLVYFHREVKPRDLGPPYWVADIPQGFCRNSANQQV